MNLSFHNNRAFLKKIDSLSTGPEWTCQIVTAHGNKVGEDGVMMSEDLELWKRNPVDCVKELISNPAFRDLMAYVPQRVYSNKGGTNRVYDEMWTGDWWWNTQVSVSKSRISSNQGLTFNTRTNSPSEQCSLLLSSPLTKRHYLSLKATK